MEDVSNQFPKFYHDAGQLLTKWIAQAPKIKEKEPESSSIPTIFSEARVLANVEGGKLVEALAD